MIVFFIGFFSETDVYCRGYLQVKKELKENTFEKNIFDSLGESKRQPFFSELYSNLIIQTQAPFKMNKKEALFVFASVGCTVGLIFLDKSIDNTIRPVSVRYKSIGEASSNLTELGGTYGFGLTAAFAGFSFIAQNKEGIQTSRLLAQSLLTVTIWSRIGKAISSRQRPLSFYSSQHDVDDEWSVPFNFMTRKGRSLSGSNFDAFPSGHTATAFAIATVFATQYKDHIAVPIIAYSFASVVGITRMIEHEHWASDVFAGACLGYLCAKQVCIHADKNNSHRQYLQCYANYMNHSFITGCSFQF